MTMNNRPISQVAATSATSATNSIYDTTPIRPMYGKEKGVLDVCYTMGVVKNVADPAADNGTVIPETPQHVPAQSVTHPSPFVVRLGAMNRPVKLWPGEKMTGTEIAFDTETALITGHEAPRLALATASNGVVTYIIHPKNIAAFVELHKDAHWICHNAPFDFWVLHRHLTDCGRKDLLTELWRMVDENRLHDTMLLDQLLQLAIEGSEPIPHALNVVAGEWAGIHDLDKSDPYRLRYSEIIGTDWGQVDGGFFTYAAKDPIATFLAYQQMKEAALKMALQHSKSLWPDAVNRFGLLSESVQVKASIALAQVERLGMPIDREALVALDKKLVADIKRLTGEISSMPEATGLFKRDKDNLIKLTETGMPSMSEKPLQDILHGVVEHCKRVGLPPIESNSKGLSTKEDFWMPYAPYSVFVQKWLELRRTGKLRSFSKMAGTDRIHPHYSVLTRTGRTACGNPNLQQIPRGGGFRECFVASVGYYFFTIDYSFIELVTLAATCLQRYGHSHLAEVIRQGVDPHVNTAAMILGIPLAEFQKMKTTAPEKYKDARQKAKALNFGIPGGLGAARLQEYARTTYGVILSPAEAEAWRNKVITEIYPELYLYLSDNTMSRIAHTLGCDENVLWLALDSSGERPGWLPYATIKIVSGNPTKVNGEPYNPAFVDSVWLALTHLNCHGKIRPFLTARKAGADLEMMFNETATTLTGRIRAKASFCEARNTPFQGLASDGAKLACYELVKAGYRLVGFIHDEFIVELPDSADKSTEAVQIEKIVCKAMSSVLNNSVPVKAEYSINKTWAKK